MFRPATFRPLALAAFLALLAACSAAGGGGSAAAPQPTRKTVLDDQLKALQKAKDVQKTVDDAAKAEQKAIDDAGG